MRAVVRRSASGLAPCAYGVALLAAAFGVPILFVLAVALTYVAEPMLKRDAPKTNQMFGRLGFGLSVRYALRDTALVVMIARLHAATALETALVAVAVVAMIGSRAAFRWLAQRTADRRTLPILTRNVDLSGCNIPDAAPEFLVRGGDVPMLYVSGIPLLGVLFGVVPALIATAAAACIAVGLVAAAVQPARRAGRMPSSKKVLAEVKRQIHGYAPEVVIYFSGTRPSVYQPNMWLPVAARLRQRTVIVLRQRANMLELAATSLPVICIPDSVDLINFDIPSMRVVLYPTHVGQNIHFLRIPGVAHVFICHGESDKLASVNPYSKAYDEVWVAGPAARERYALADVGVRDEDIVEVGGPQLALIQQESPARSTVDPRGLTVLYAPTWEGWVDDPQNTSLIAAGPSIVARLLAHPAVAHVIYKPHPLTGTRSAPAARSSKKIVSLLSGGSLALNRADTMPSLYECFNACDVLITDISGVVADFLVSGKPYVITNFAGLDDDAFRAKYPTTRGAYLITPDLADLDGTLTDLHTDADVMAEERRKLAAYVLGDDGGAGDRFQTAVDQLIATATQRMIRRGDIPAA